MGGKMGLLEREKETIRLIDELIDNIEKLNNQLRTKVLYRYLKVAKRTFLKRSEKLNGTH
jgi:hypothetical protein